ncbi:hypothetical protein IAU59_003301 [Kwoniella sp. CBS 9459]
MPQVAKWTQLSSSSQTGLSSVSLTAAIDPSPAFELTAIPGKGLGLVATRYIKRGELILRESPFVLVPLEHEDQEISSDSVRGIFERLTVEERANFESLYGREDKQAENDPLVNIVVTNSIPLYREAESEDGHPKDFMGLGLFYMISRINHSCTPNAGWIWYGDEGSMHLYAYTDVSVDTELCASYLDAGILYTQKTRRHKLRQDYGFDCFCTACNRSSEHARATDENLRICSRICRRWERSELRNYARDLPRAVEEITLMIDLLKKEGKWVMLGPSYEQLFYVYACHGKEVEAKAAGQQALAAYMITHGPRKAAQLSFAIEARDPIQSPHWADLVHHRSDRKRVQFGQNTTMKQLPTRTLSLARKTAGPGPTALDAVTLVINEEDTETETETGTDTETKTKMEVETEVEMEMEVETDTPTPSPPEEDVTKDKKRWKGGDRKRGKSQKLRWDQDGPFTPPKSHKRKRTE